MPSTASRTPFIDGGADNDTAYYDQLADPAPVAVEIHFPR
jgi:hypothetical protein